jgi:glucose/arabinose dehydrogenase
MRGCTFPCDPCRFGPDGRLYVAIGAPCDDCADACPAFGSLRYCTITSMKADGSDHTVFATGVLG